jgi:hypothetical protein
LTGLGATLGAWNNAHQQDSKYQGFPAYGPAVSTPEGPTPQFIEIMEFGTQITQFTEVLPGGTSLSSAQQIALTSLPADAVPQSLVASDQNGSCQFWNLSSQSLAATGQSGAITIEMAYDDSNGSPHNDPNNMNTLTFEFGTNDSSGTC